MYSTTPCNCVQPSFGLNLPSLVRATTYSPRTLLGLAVQELLHGRRNYRDTHVRAFHDSRPKRQRPGLIQKNRSRGQSTSGYTEGSR
ncbi:hypothetical protein K523DRAFT_71522 [Schizophyllum commune Tattone D]|nr:hypothetical protein K523DRAFT_71522 [Schizophyllum commune Tattone D]